LWQSVLLAEETRVPGENQWPVASHWQTLPQAYRSYKAKKIIKIIYFLKLLVKISNTYVKLHKTFFYNIAYVYTLCHHFNKQASKMHGKWQVVSI
jgi:hypothetical protein